MPLDLAAVKAARAAMAPGRWGSLKSGWTISLVGDDDKPLQRGMCATGSHYPHVGAGYRPDDRDGIVAIVNAADEMIAEIERLRVLTFADHTPDDVTEAMLRSEVLRLRAELDRVTPYLAAHGACGYGFTASTKTGGNE